jgi:hypothetical protein
LHTRYKADACQADTKCTTYNIFMWNYVEVNTFRTKENKHPSVLEKNLPEDGAAMSKHVGVQNLT